jgi:L-aspartate oxidase
MSVRHAGVTTMEHTFGLDLMIGHDPQGRRAVAGVRVARLDDDGNVLDVGVVTARAVIIATGGYGQIYASTSNPPSLTGDGVAMALRAGVPSSNLEFIQFHPTVLWRGSDSFGQQALISEAVRGEGAQLFDGLGRRIMQGVHPQEDLAPRDVVSAAISARMAEAPNGIDSHVFLDARSIDRFDERFPTITASCLEIGVDPATDLIPVAPAAHYACGGIVADLDGRTALAGLFAVGEAACTGVHGANRLASNSLTEAVVSGTRLGRALNEVLPPVAVDAEESAVSVLLDGARRQDVRTVMSRSLGVVRTPEGMANAIELLDDLAESATGDAVASRRSFEATNLLSVAIAVAAAAMTREESRGCHHRSDFVEKRDEWRRTLTVTSHHGLLEVE